jgi:hypothetical protein
MQKFLKLLIFSVQKISSLFYNTPSDGQRVFNWPLITFSIGIFALISALFCPPLLFVVPVLLAIPLISVFSMPASIPATLIVPEKPANIKISAHKSNSIPGLVVTVDKKNDTTGAFFSNNSDTSTIKDSAPQSEIRPKR